MRNPPSALAWFDRLPAREKWFVRARWFSAPVERVLAKVPAKAMQVADIGCGHGLVTAMLAEGKPGCHVLGVDPDPAKIRWAKEALAGLPHVTLEVATLEALLPNWAGKLDVVVVNDVLYLLPISAWAGFFEAAGTLLRPGGTLLLKDAESGRGWRSLKCQAQEWLMVKLLRKTQGSGGLGFHPRQQTVRALEQAGFLVAPVEDLSAGFTTPHVLFEATKPEAM